MVSNLEYKVLNQQVFEFGDYQLVPIRYEDRLDIMKWRNEQIYHLRQKQKLTKNEQDFYFKNVVSTLFEQEQPQQILFSFLKNNKCIGYGGLVHINWTDLNAEISFIMDTAHEKRYFKENWFIFLKLIQKCAFEVIKLHKICTYAYDLRPSIYEIFEEEGFIREAKLKEHFHFDGKYIDVIIHSKFKSDFMKFKSERLELVEFSEDLLTDHQMRWFENRELMEFYTNSKRKITKEELVNSVEKGFIDQDSYTYFIRHKESNTLIGTIKLGPIVKAHKISDLVALIGEKGDFGKGLGTEAIKLGIKLAFDKYDIRKLYGGMYESNIASIKAYTRAGWIVEGVLNGHYLNEGKNENRILVGCFNPKYFTTEEIESAKHEDWYKSN